jgi:hypothetical protein
MVERESGGCFILDEIVKMILLVSQQKTTTSPPVVLPPASTNQSGECCARPRTPAALFARLSGGSVTPRARGLSRQDGWWTWAAVAPEHQRQVRDENKNGLQRFARGERKTKQLIRINI